VETDQLKVRCACGWETSGAEPEVIEATLEHGQRLHNMTATRAQILAMAVPAGDSTASTPAGSPTPAP